MRNKALNATLKQRSTPIINGTEITSRCRFCWVMVGMGEGMGGERAENRRNIAFNCVKRITLNIKDAKYLEDD